MSLEAEPYLSVLLSLSGNNGYFLLPFIVALSFTVAQMDSDRNFFTYNYFSTFIDNEHIYYI